MAARSKSSRVEVGRVIPLDSMAPHQIAHEGPAIRQLELDDWGRDRQLIHTLSPVTSLRWDVSVGGAEHIHHGGALIIVNTRRFALTPVYAALALSEALDRPVRFVGRPDGERFGTAPIGGFLRRLGALLAHPAEIATALRAGDAVVLGTSPTSNPAQAGQVDHTLVAAAIREHVPVYVAATMSAAFSRQARVEVGPAVHPLRRRRGPLAEVEMAEQAQHRLQTLLDEVGPSRPLVPGFGWLGALP